MPTRALQAKNSHQAKLTATFYSHLRNALLIPTVFGAVPFSLRGSRVRLVAWKVAFSILCASLVFVLCTYAVAVPNPLLTKSSFSMFIFIFQAIPFSISPLAFIYYFVVHHDQFEAVIDKLLKVNRILSNLDANPKKEYKWIYNIIAPVSIASLAISHVLWLRNLSPPLLAMFFSFQYAFIYIFGYLELMFFLVDYIWFYLEEVVRRVEPREAVLVQLCSAHDILSDAVSCLQKIYGFPSLCITFCSFLFINANIFICIKRGSHFGESYLFDGWVVIGCIPVIRIAHKCGRATRKGNEFYSVLYRMIKKDNTFKLLHNGILKAHLMKKKPFSFNAAGFSELDFKFVGGMVAATATYTVILIQMGGNF